LYFTRRVELRDVDIVIEIHACSISRVSCTTSAAYRVSSVSVVCVSRVCVSRVYVSGVCISGVCVCVSVVYSFCTIGIAIDSVGFSRESSVGIETRRDSGVFSTIYSIISVCVGVGRVGSSGR
jgi:hypothetical protein